MKNLSFAVAFLALACNLVSAQNTETLFSLEGLSIVVVVDIPWMDTPYSSIHFIGKEEDCGRPLLKFSDKAEDKNMYMEIEGAKVFLGEDCNELSLAFDFALEIGESVMIDNILHSVTHKELVQYLDGRDRIHMELLRGTEQVIWVEGIGDLTTAFMNPSNAHENELGCVSDDNGAIYLANGVSEDICASERCRILRPFLLESDDLSISVSAEGTNGDSFFWDFGDSTTSMEMNTEHSYDNGGCYFIELQVMNDCGEEETFTRSSANCVDSIWTADYISCIESQCISSMDFATDLVGMMIEASRVLKTTDGGITWVPVLDLSDQSAEVVMNNQDEAIVMVPNSRIIITKDGGITWETTEYQNVKSVGYTDDRIFLHSPADSLIRYSSDNGLSWFEFQIENRELLELRIFDDFQMVDEGYFVGVNAGRTLFVSSDNGQTWETKPLDIKQSATYSTHFLDAETGFVGALGSISKTIDGGDTWNEVMLPLENSLIKNIEFRDALNGWAVGANIWRTTDGGESWALEYCQFSGWIHAINDLSITENEIHTYIDGKGVYSRNPDTDFNCISSLAEQEDFQSLSIYPNPTFGSIHCNSNMGSGTYQLYDAHGRLIEQNPFTENAFEIDVVHFDSGIYFLTLHDEKAKIASAKFIKK